MHEKTSFKTKILFSLIGLSALVVPLILLATDFQPLGFVMKKEVEVTQSSPPDQVEKPKGVPLLSRTEYEQAVAAATKTAVIDVRDAASDSDEAIKQSHSQLETTVQDSTGEELKTIFRAEKLIIVTDAIEATQPLAAQIQAKGVPVSLYLKYEP